MKQQTFIALDDTDEPSSKLSTGAMADRLKDFLSQQYDVLYRRTG